jgi:1-acyl-sn-glycerol-3-phosphate acyltransferase
MQNITTKLDDNSIERAVRSQQLIKSKWRAVARLFQFFGITTLYIMRFTRDHIGGMILKKKKFINGTYYLQDWARHCNRKMGVRVTVQGNPPEKGALLTSNHRSYMDITAIGEIIPTTFLAKREVSRWPVLGYGCKLVNVVFVDRESPESRQKSIEEISERIANGMSIVVFPEGTSYAGPGVLSFKPGVFRTAAQGRVRVVPIAIYYEDPSDAWVGNDTFVRHFMQTFSKPEIRVTVSFGPALQSEDPDELMKSSRKWIHSAIMQGIISAQS